MRIEESKACWRCATQFLQQVGAQQQKTGDFRPERYVHYIGAVDSKELRARVKRFAVRVVTQRLADFPVIHGHRPGTAFHQMAAFHFHCEAVLEREGGADYEIRAR